MISRRYKNGVTSYDNSAMRRQLTIVQFVEAAAASSEPRASDCDAAAQCARTRPALLDFLMSWITHNNQDVIFQLPTPRTPRRSNNENYGRQRTHRPTHKGVSRMSRYISPELNNNRNSFHFFPFWTSRIIGKAIALLSSTKKAILYIMPGNIVTRTSALLKWTRQTKV